MKTSRKFEPVLVISLIVALLLVIFLSWIITAVFPRAPIRSLLNDVGIRWLFGSFTDSVSSPLEKYIPAIKVIIKITTFAMFLI